VDVARFGSCETAIAARQGETLVGLQHWRGVDLMHTCGRVVQSCRELRPQRVVIDAVGLGAGLVDRLLELQREGEAALREVQIVAFSSGTRAVNPERYGSRRDEAYWELRDEHGQLRARVNRLDPEASAPGADAPQTTGTTAFVPLSSLRR